jgi:hypothetical protein
MLVCRCGPGKCVLAIATGKEMPGPFKAQALSRCQVLAFLVITTSMCALSPKRDSVQFR